MANTQQKLTIRTPGCSPSPLLGFQEVCMVELVKLSDKTPSSFVVAFPSTGFMTDHLHTYVPSFIMVAVVEFTAAALPLILVCDKKQRKYRLNEHSEREDKGEHLRPVVWETTL